MTSSALRIAVTAGEPAGIGPDLTLELSKHDWPFELVIIADPRLLAERAETLGVTATFSTHEASRQPEPSRAGRICVAPVSMQADSTPGVLKPVNATYVLDALRYACAGCQSGEFAALVTGPVHKGVINDAGVAFTGHTEFLAQLTDTAQPVMLLVAGDLRVALATTHVPLTEVSALIRPERIEAVCRILADGLQQQFGIAEPRITVLGLNPHAGEGGHLGSEDTEIIAPVLEKLRDEGLTIDGPVAADTAFTPNNLQGLAAVLAMYHDQGLPVLKYAGFGRAVNVTLGLPIIRTSVDHGTALELAGSGKADPGSLTEAVKLAAAIADRVQA